MVQLLALPLEEPPLTKEKMKALRIFAALFVAFGPLFFATPAQASTTIQFTYHWTAQEFTFTDEQVTVVVTNDITNKIGGNGEVIDTYRITLGTQVIEVTEKHGARPYVFDIVGTQTIKLEGIDNGYWGGNYGPIMEVSSTPLAPPAPQPEPNWWAQQNWEGETVTLTAPEGWVFYSVRAWYGSPDDWACGQDVSSILEALMVGQHSVTVALDNGTFGDPCGGVVKVTRFTWSIVPQTNTVEPTPTATPQTPEPTAEPSLTPAPETQPTPTTSPEPLPSQPEPSPAPEPVPPVVTPPVIEPAPQPQPIPFPVEPEPQPEPVVTPQPEPVPSPSETETPVPVVVPPVVLPTPEPVVVEPSPEPPVEPKPIVPPKEDVSNIATVDLDAIDPQELTTAEVAKLVSAAVEVLATAEQGSPQYEKALEALAVAAQADDEELPAELAAIPLLGDVAGAALELFNNLGNIGADMAPAEREKAEKTIVGAVIVGQVAQMATAAAASAGAAAAASTRKIK